MEEKLLTTIGRGRVRIKTPRRAHTPPTNYRSYIYCVYIDMYR